VVVSALLRQSKGRIVNLSSTLGRLFAPEYALSTATKHAVEGLSDALRTELLDLGVSVSIVQPGYVKSAIHNKALDAKVRRWRMARRLGLLIVCP
jgi:short-subunit dehydrogenase